jgi:hypothetical protein
MPCLVYFENGVPELYSGDLLNDNAIMKWMMSELKQVSSRYFRKLDHFVAKRVIKLNSFKQKENIKIYDGFFLFFPFNNIYFCLHRIQINMFYHIIFYKY